MRLEIEFKDGRTVAYVNVISWYVVGDKLSVFSDGYRKEYSMDKIKSVMGILPRHKR